MAAGGGGADEKVAGTSKWTKHGSGFLWDLSAEQKENLAAFLARVAREDVEVVKGPHETLESFAARFLRARKYDVELALTMVDKAAKWRRGLGSEAPRQLATREIDELLGCPVEELRRFYPNSYVPVLDKEWRPVYFEKTGHLDIEALLCSTTPEALLKWHLACQEGYTAKRLAVATKQRGDGRVVESTCNVLDLEGFSLSQLGSVTRQYLSDASSTDSDNYPETLGKLLIINAPSIFSYAWGIIKGLLDERTQSKIEVLGEDYREALFDLLGGEDHVPIEYGGKLAMPGGLYANHNVVDLAVHSGKVESVELPITKGKTFRVRWIARPGDIVFSVKFAPASGAPGHTHDVSPTESYPACHERTVQVVHVAPSDGTYIVSWDNSAGWTQRIVHYSCVVLEDFLTKRQAERVALATLPWHGPRGTFTPDIVVAEGKHGDVHAAAPGAAAGGGASGTA